MWRCQNLARLDHDVDAPMSILFEDCDVKWSTGFQFQSPVSVQALSVIEAALAIHSTPCVVCTDYARLCSISHQQVMPSAARRLQAASLSVAEPCVAVPAEVSRCPTNRSVGPPSPSQTSHWWTPPVWTNDLTGFTRTKGQMSTARLTASGATLRRFCGWTGQVALAGCGSRM